mmetsp:Transcript_8652/g.26211  ORF Transcript_8652/g.26211 Transcript_8652/m.26211 type:complete len:193 (+) Transcript_8652:765-1343(+)
MPCSHHSSFSRADSGGIGMVVGLATVGGGGVAAGEAAVFRCQGVWRAASSDASTVAESSDASTQSLQAMLVSTGARCSSSFAADRENWSDGFVCLQMMHSMIPEAPKSSFQEAGKDATVTRARQRRFVRDDIFTRVFAKIGETAGPAANGKNHRPDRGGRRSQAARRARKTARPRAGANEARALRAARRRAG